MLPPDCSPVRAAGHIDRTLFTGATTAIGEFRCPVGHPAFADSGPIERFIVVFPRSSVWITHVGSRPFVADPTVVTIYNRAQQYRRSVLSPDGDRCDWFAVSDDVARDIATALDPRSGECGDRPFRFERAPCTPALYLRQRRLARRSAKPNTSALAVEHAVVDLVADVLALACQHAPAGAIRQQRTARRHREIVENAKAELLRTVAQNRSVSDIAAAVGASVFHLCRVFRSQTGRTMHEYLMELRVRVALERLADDGVTVSSVAHELGFSSHSHLGTVCRRHFGAAPRKVRELLTADGRAEQ